MKLSDLRKAFEQNKRVIKKPRRKNIKYVCSHPDCEEKGTVFIVGTGKALCINHSTFCINPDCRGLQVKDGFCRFCLEKMGRSVL